MLSGKTHRSRYVGLNMVTFASIVVQSAQPSMAMYMERSVENVAGTTTSGWYAGHY